MLDEQTAFKAIDGNTKYSTTVSKSRCQAIAS